MKFLIPFADFSKTDLYENCQVLVRHDLTEMLSVASIIIVHSLFILPVYAQPVQPLKDISKLMYEQYAVSLQHFSANKKMPELFKKQIVCALSFYPELKTTRIHVKLNSSGIISTRPAWSSVLRRSSKRKYIIFINNSDKSKWSKVLFRHSDINGQVGITGHELTHILHFNRLSTWGLLGIGLGHISTRYMDRFENKTDSICIERGLGHQLISWNIFLRKAFGMQDPENGPDPFFGSTTRERYMSPASIRRVMRNSKTYQ